MFKRTALIILVCIGTAVFFSLSAYAAHNPRFSWRIRGDVNYRQWIYDGDDPIALFDMSSMDEPMQALMMFQKVPRPVLLKHLKLSPGGAPLVQAVQLYWKSSNVITDVFDGLSVEGDGTNRITVTFTVKDRWNTITVVRKLTVTYDESIESYIYDFRDNAVVHYPETLDRGAAISFEICDPWFVDCPAPSLRFPGMWKGRYRQFAYESKDGGIVSIPHNHFSQSQKSGIHLKRDGLFAAVYEPDGNPALQLMGDTAQKTSIGICPWAYDVHLGFSVTREELYAPITTHFRFFRCPDDKARELNKNAVIPPVDPASFGNMQKLPLYERISSFEKGIPIDQPHEGDLDPWFWRPMNEKGAIWDTGFGRNGSRSLKIEKDTPGLATWYAMCEGQGYFTDPWTPCKGYEISCWVKTQNVTGPGASIGVCYHVPNVPPQWPITRSGRVDGTRDWRKITVKIGPPPEDTSIMSLHLQQAGSGTTWFDDLEVKMLK